MNPGRPAHDTSVLTSSEKWKKSSIIYNVFHIPKCYLFWVCILELWTVSM